MRPNAVRATILAGSALAAGFLLPDSAAAGTVRVLTEDVGVRDEPVGSEVLSRLSFEARPGERNRVGIRVGSRAFTVTDRLPITAGRGCRRRGRRVVRCAIVEQASTFSAGLGDRSDSLRITGSLQETQDDSDERIRISGGAGHDRIVLGRRRGKRSGPLGARIAGGPGNDRLDSPGGGSTFFGGAGNDLMIGGSGTDSFVEGTGRNGRDTMVGGGELSGFGDVVSYGMRRDGVRADLDGKPDDGAAGERDRIGRDIERLVGGAGADRLTGDARRNDLLGGAGEDELSGREANDTVVGGNGADRLFGGAGNDRLQGGGTDADTLDGGPDDDQLTARGDSVTGGTGFDVISSRGGVNQIDLRDGGRDTVFCGGGGDQLRLDALDFFAFGPGLAGDCAQVDREGGALGLFHGAPELNLFTGKRAPVDFGCPGDATATCSARVRIEMKGRAYGTVEYSGEPNTTEVLLVPIDPAAAKGLAGFKAFPAVLLVSARTPSGATVERRHPIVLGGQARAGFGPVS